MAKEARGHKASSAMTWSVARKERRPDNFRTSLRPEEQDLLNLIGEAQRHTVTYSEDRKELAALLQKSSPSLADNEVDYLQKLLASSKVSAEAVGNARKTLKYSLPLTHRKELDELAGEKEGRESLRVSLVKRKKGPSYRKEVWTASQQMPKQKNNSTRKEKEETHHEVVKNDRKGVSVFGFLFGGLNKKKRQEEKAEEHFIEDDPWEYTILGTHPDDEECFPHVLTPPIMDRIRIHLPMAVSNDNFWLKYSMIRDGASIRAFHDKVHNSSRTIIAIETMEGDVFGAFVSSPWAPRGPRYFGTGEAFVWRMQKSRFTPCKTIEDQVELERSVDVYKWSGENRNIQHLESLESQLLVGGGGPDDGPHVTEKEFGPALVIMPNLESGYSNICLTFKSPQLPPSGKDENFEISNMEAWALTPMNDVDEADKVELGRRFIFEHSNFIEI